MKAFGLAFATAAWCFTAHAAQITVATVNNPDMVTMQRLSKELDEMKVAHAQLTSLVR